MDQCEVYKARQFMSVSPGYASGELQVGFSWSNALGYFPIRSRFGGANQERLYTTKGTHPITFTTGHEQRRTCFIFPPKEEGPLRVRRPEVGIILEASSCALRNPKRILKLLHGYQDDMADLVAEAIHVPRCATGKSIGAGGSPPFRYV